MSRRSPARGPGRASRKKAPASAGLIQPQASGTAMDKEEMRQRLRRVAQGFDDPEIPQEIQQQLRDNLRQMAADIGAQFAPRIAKAIEEDHAEYFAATGQVLPTTLDDMNGIVTQARVAGWTAAESEAGEYTLAAIHRQAVAAKILRDQRVEDEARTRLAVAAASPSPWPPVDSPERIANEISGEFRKVLATLREGGAIGLADCMKRLAIEERSGLTACRVRHVLEEQSPRITPSLIETKTGAGGGVWLTAEGSLVASLIDKNILPRITIPPQKKGIR